MSSKLTTSIKYSPNHQYSFVQSHSSKVESSRENSLSTAKQMMTTDTAEHEAKSSLAGHLVDVV